MRLKDGKYVLFTERKGTRTVSGPDGLRTAVYFNYVEVDWWTRRNQRRGFFFIPGEHSPKLIASKFKRAGIEIGEFIAWKMLK